MLNFSTPVSEKHSYNNFSMKEKAPISKINLRGDLENKDFVNKIPLKIIPLKAIPLKA